MSDTTPSPEVVAAYAKVIGCEREGWYCYEHLLTWTDLGCPIAVEVARVPRPDLIAGAHRQQAICTCGSGGFHEPGNPLCGRNCEATS